jgi:hypothetical protein
MRRDVLDAVRALADPEYQRRVWLERRYPHEGFFDDFTLNINTLYDDTQVLEDPHQAIGYVLRSAKEVTAMERLSQALGALFDRLGTELSDEEYVSAPEWESVVGAAREALAELERW